MGRCVTRHYHKRHFNVKCFRNIQFQGSVTSHGLDDHQSMVTFNCGRRVRVDALFWSRRLSLSWILTCLALQNETKFLQFLLCQSLLRTVVISRMQKQWTTSSHFWKKCPSLGWTEFEKLQDTAFTINISIQMNWMSCIYYHIC